MQQQSIKQSLTLVQQKIAQALKKSTKTQNVNLVAVSKYKPIELIQEAYDSGIRHFGENYVDEFVEKSTKLPQDINWHFIGHLQTNKVNKVVVPSLYIIETVDSQKLATKIDNTCQKIDKKLKVFVQVKTSDEDTKFGVSEEDSYQLVEHILQNCNNLLFSGLMTVGKSGDLSAFEQLQQLRQKICEKFDLKLENVELSMGMSGDFEEAIQYGATNVRVGSSIFGAREFASQKEKNEALRKKLEEEQQQQQKQQNQEEEQKKE